MKKFSLSFFALTSVVLSFAQDNADIDDFGVINDDDTSEITTIADIIDVQEDVLSRKSNVAHHEKVWSYNSYFGFAYSSSKLSPKTDIPLGYDYNNGLVPEFKSDWGLTLMLGHSYGLHKPIAGILKFNIDYTYINLAINHYKAEDGDKLYDSNAINDQSKYLPWCLDKYEYSYSMTLGPSITVAPFTHTGSNGLHFLRFNMFYHIGYQLAFVDMINDNKYDINTTVGVDKLNRKAVWGLGHGLTNSFGFKLSWKTIGFGCEWISGNLNYRNFSSTYGRNHYKFKESSSRVFLEIRF